MASIVRLPDGKSVVMGQIAIHHGTYKIYNFLLVPRILSTRIRRKFRGLLLLCVHMHTREASPACTHALLDIIMFLALRDQSST